MIVSLRTKLNSTIVLNSTTCYCSTSGSSFPPIASPSSPLTMISQGMESNALPQSFLDKVSSLTQLALTRFSLANTSSSTIQVISMSVGRGQNSPPSIPCEGSPILLLCRSKHQPYVIPSTNIGRD